MGKGGTSYLGLWLPPSPSPTPPPPPYCLAKLCRSTAAPSTPRRRAAAGAISLNLSSLPCWIKKEETWLFRTCVERGGAVRSALVIGDLDHVEYDYIITVLLNASARDLQRYVDASNHSLLDELLDDLGETSRKIFVFCNVPQQWHHELGLCVVLLARVEHNLLWA